MSGTGTAGTARKLPRAHSLLVMAGIGLLAGGCLAFYVFFWAAFDGNVEGDLLFVFAIAPHKDELRSGTNFGGGNRPA